MLVEHKQGLGMEQAISFVYKYMSDLKIDKIIGFSMEEFFCLYLIK
jgi:hypothetical protein